MRRLLIIFGVFLLLTLLIIAGLGFWVSAQFKQPGPLEQTTTIVIPNGAGISVIARDLAAENVILDPFLFRLAARYTKTDKSLRAGEYSVPARISMMELLDLIRAGKTIVRRLTIAEGLRVDEIMIKLDQIHGLFGDIKTQPVEGSLLPETYHFSYGDTRQSIVERMTKSMNEVLEKMWNGRSLEIALSSPMEALILASIVEKETGQKAERGRVAAVFHNRLRLGMRLQSDPVVIYGLTKGKGELGHGLRKSELKKDTPFNTYIINGLPPTPIANPGKAALYAVLHPDKTNELYFVADGSGGHVFAKTLKEHNNNVRNWRKIEKKKIDSQN